MRKLLASLALGIALLGGSAPAVAQLLDKAGPQVGQWSIETTVVSSGRPWNILQVCLKEDGTWYSTEQRKGSGRWIAKGGRVLFHGTFEVLSNSADVAMTSPTRMTGSMQQWVNNSLAADNMSNLYASSSWTWLSASCKPAL